MSRGRAYLSAATMTILLVLATGFLFFRPDPGGAVTVKAEFADVFPLLVGNKVRVYGGIAGQVTKIQLTPRSTVMVTMKLNDGASAPRADATASVRAQDLLGENYLALSPGHSKQPLTGPIPRSRSAVAPRLSNLLDTFDARTRTGLQAVLTELGVALDHRGVDVNRALLALRPALTATDELLGEASSQNASLRTLIPQLHNATRQLADRHDDLGALVTNLATILKATAQERPEIARGLERLPQTLQQVGDTGTKLAALGQEAKPLANDLQAVAPTLNTAATLLPDFLKHADRSVDSLTPTLDRAGELLITSRPTLDKLKVALSGLKDAGPSVSDLLTNFTNPQDSAGPLTYTTAPTQSVGHKPLPEAYPVTGQSALRRLVAGLLGSDTSYLNTYSQPGSPNPDRTQVRAAAVITCESFGLPKRPGCLGKVVTNLTRYYNDVASGAIRALPGSAIALAGKTLPGLIKLTQTSAKKQQAANQSKPTGSDHGAASGDPTTSTTPATPSSPQPVPAVKKEINAVLNTLLPGLGGGGAPKSPNPPPAPPANTAGKLLDYLLGP